MVAATISLKTFLDNLDLPFPSDDARWYYTHMNPNPLKWALATVYEYHNPERAAEIVHQIHFWISKEEGLKKEGFRWIYNTIEKWQRDQFFWISKSALWRTFKFLEEIGWVVSNNYNGNPFEREKWYTLDYVQIFIDTKGIWNPWGLDLERLDKYPRPPGFVKGLSLGSTRDVDDDIPLTYIVEEEPLPDPSSEDNEYKSSEAETRTVVDFSYSKNENSARVSSKVLRSRDDLHPKNSKKKASFYTKDWPLEKEKSKSSGNLEESIETQEEQVPQNSVDVNGSVWDSNNSSDTSNNTRSGKNFPPPPPPPGGHAVDNFGKQLESSKSQKESHSPSKQLPDCVIASVDGKCVFGICNGQYVIPSDFIRWRARTHYVPQGRQWQASAKSNAAAELTRCLRENPEKAKWIWQDFLEYTERSADTTNAIAPTNAAQPDGREVQPTLPTIFEEDTRDTTEVAKKILQAKNVVEKAKIAKQLKAEKKKAEELAALPPPDETEEERFWRKTREAVERHKISWKYFKDKPGCRPVFESLIKFVENSPRLIITPDGPDIDPNYVFVPNTEA